MALRFVRCLRFILFPGHSKYTSNMAAWF